MISQRTAILYAVAVILMVSVIFYVALGVQVDVVGAGNDLVFSAEAIDFTFNCPLNGFH